ncbi:Fumarate reductase flavoprotein subunit [Clostridiaceae bacterium JG1575]|nr:Fumarate reductase flavoprotein subunit [Clostridiaceae bacterium JG1575]
MKNKRILSILTGMVLAVSLSACSKTPTDSKATAAGQATVATQADTKPQTAPQGTAPAGTSKQKMKPGTYEGSAKGMNGEVTAKVEVSEDKIISITADATKETEGLGDKAVEEVVSEILRSQSIGVDTITGATLSSHAVLSAVTQALTKAGADIEAMKKYVGAPAQKIEAQTTDAVVIGAGGAGMSAAVELAKAGKKVIVVEQMPLAGGNTMRATAGMNAAETKVQAGLKMKDTREAFYNDTFKGGKKLNDPALLRVLVDHSSEAVDWVNQLGAGLERVTLTGGATNPRTHSPKDGAAIGPVIVRVLSNKLNDLKVEVLLKTQATKILQNEGKITGIEAKSAKGQTFRIHAKAVIVATGGFGANHEMVEGYNPNLKGFSTTNHEGAKGTGILMAQAVGAALTQMDQIQIHPTTDPETGYMFTEALRGDGAILLNQDGKRFIDELQTRDVVSKNIMEQKGGVAWLIMNQEMRSKNKSLDGYIKKGYAVEAKDLASLAKAVQMPEAQVASTMTAYADAVAAQKDASFGRTHLTEPLSVGSYYAIKVKPSIHHTMGGLKINASAQVLDQEGNVLPGLYAAGECTGGIHGGNRIGGNAMTDIIVFGRIAGQSAAKELK